MAGLPLVLALAAAAANPILPGLWEYTSTGLGSGSVEQHCLTQKDIAKVFAGFSNRHYECTYPVREVGGGRWKFEGTCSNRKHPSQKAGIELAGAYAAEAFDLKGHVSPEVLPGLSLPVSATLTAKRVGATCTPPKDTDAG